VTSGASQTRPAGIDHVAVIVPDVPAALAFYVDVLGLRLDDARPELGIAGAWLDTAGGAQVHLIEGEADPAPGSGFRHFALAYDDLDHAVHELRARGVTVSDPTSVGQTGRRQALTRDPWGNGIELHQRP
jgi:glyoxylase I family protein